MTEYGILRDRYWILNGTQTGRFSSRALNYATKPAEVSMGRPLQFKFVRDTPNYRLFSAWDEVVEADRNIWLPAGLTNATEFSAFIGKGDVRHMGVYADGVKLRCCERDSDGDGNCDIHSAPGVLRELYKKDRSTGRLRFVPVDARRHETISVDIETRGLYGVGMAEMTARDYPFSKPRGMVIPEVAQMVERDLAEMERTIFSTRVSDTPHILKELLRRVRRLEERQGLLFIAFDKLLRLIKANFPNFFKK